MQGARVVWSPAEPNWQAAISAITVDPSAARYSRRTDALPVRTEQLYLDNLDALEQLLDLKLNQVIDWVWLPADEIRSALKHGPLMLASLPIPFASSEGRRHTP